jgi:hypothetical protein
MYVIHHWVCKGRIKKRVARAQELRDGLCKLNLLLLM